MTSQCQSHLEDNLFTNCEVQTARFMSMEEKVHLGDITPMSLTI